MSRHMIVALIGAILGVISLVVSITYLGPTFDSKPALEIDDWRRKFLLFFAWFNVVYYSIMLIFIKDLERIHRVGIIFTLLAELLIITYLGPTFEESKKIDSDDWRRKFTLFFAWFGVGILGLCLLPLIPILLALPIVK